jgi:hypothetical protein
MRRGFGALLVALLALTCLDLGWPASSATAATPHVLFRAPGMLSMMAGSGRIAWTETARFGSVFRIWVRSDVSGIRHPLTRSLAPANGSEIVLATTPRRVFWDEIAFGNSETDNTIRSSSASGTTRVDPLLLNCGANGCDCGDVGDALGPAAHLGDTLVYATSHYKGDPTDCAMGGGQILTGGSLRASLNPGHTVLGSAPGASLLAASRGRVAELPLVPGGPAQPNIEVLSATNGAPITTIATGGLVTGLGMSRAGLVAQVDTSGSQALRLYKPATGALVRSVWVRRTSKLINCSGERCIYTVSGKQIHTLNLISGRTHLVYRARFAPLDLRLDGRLIAWRRTAVLGITLPRIT